MGNDGHEERGKAAGTAGDTETGIARRMLLRRGALTIPAILAAFSVSTPVYAARTCSPNLCIPGDSCNPGVCGPIICNPGRSSGNSENLGLEESADPASL